MLWFLGFSTCFYTKRETVRYSYVSLKVRCSKCFICLPSFCFSVFIISDANSVSFFPILEVFRLLRQHRRHRVCMRRTAYRPEKTTCLDSMDIVPADGLLPSLLGEQCYIWWWSFTTSRRFHSALYGSRIVIWYMIDICIRVKQSLVQLTETLFEVNSKGVVTERNPKGVPSQYSSCIVYMFVCMIYVYIHCVHFLQILDLYALWCIMHLRLALNFLRGGQWIVFCLLNLLYYPLVPRILFRKSQHQDDPKSHGALPLSPR